MSQGFVTRSMGVADLHVHTAGRGLAVHAAGIDAAQLRAAREALIGLVSEPRGQDVAGPEARRADQAEATISSTE